MFPRRTCAVVDVNLNMSVEGQQVAILDGEVVNSEEVLKKTNTSFYHLQWEHGGSYSRKLKLCMSTTKTDNVM